MQRRFLLFLMLAGVTVTPALAGTGCYVCHPYEPPCYLPFDDQHRCCSPTYAPWCQPCNSICHNGYGYGYGYPDNPCCAPYEPCQPNVPGRPCQGPCGGPYEQQCGPGCQQPYGGCATGACYGPYGGGCNNNSCCWPLGWWGCSQCCTPCRPALRVYVGPRISRLKVRGGVLVADIDEMTPDVTESIQVERRQATMAGVQAGVWYRAAGKIFEQLEGYWDRGDPNSRDAVERTRRWERYEVKGRIGATAGIGCFCSLLVTPYAGYGFRWFEDTFGEAVIEIPPDPPDVFVLPETRFAYACYYVPIGGILTLQIGNCFEIGVLAEYQATVANRLKIQVEGLEDLVLQNCRWRLSRRNSWTVEVPITVKLGPCCVQLDASVVPFYKDVRYGGVEVPDFLVGGDPDTFIEIPNRRHITYGVRVEFGLRI